MGLNLDHLRIANTARLTFFTNSKGILVHPNGEDWTLVQWSNAMCGEAGETANVVKKIDRGDFTLAEARGMLSDEIADVIIYLDHLARCAGIDLSHAVMGKFNKTSGKIGCNVFLGTQSADEKFDMLEAITGEKAEAPRSINPFQYAQGQVNTLHYAIEKATPGSWMRCVCINKHVFSVQFTDKQTFKYPECVRCKSAATKIEFNSPPPTNG